MRCPYCRTGLEESSVECPSCRLTLDRAVSLLGPVPRTSAGIGDNAGLLSPHGKKKIAKAIRRLEWAFSQVRIHVLLREFPQNHPFDLHVFWFFNCGELSREHVRGGENHAILLALDPGQGKSALMAGYGLEPFLADSALDHLLELAEPSWKSGAWEKGILDVLAGIGRVLESAAREAAEAFGFSALAAGPESGEY